jgi:hypothetical protein
LPNVTRLANSAMAATITILAARIGIANAPVRVIARIAS